MLRQHLQDLGEKMKRDAEFGGNFADRHPGAFGPQRDKERGADGMITGLGEYHGGSPIKEKRVLCLKYNGFVNRMQEFFSWWS